MFQSDLYDLNGSIRFLSLINLKNESDRSYDQFAVQLVEPADPIRSDFQKIVK